MLKIYIKINKILQLNEQKVRQQKEDTYNLK